MLTTKDIRALMNSGHQIQVLHVKRRHGPTFIVDLDNPKHVYGQVSRCVLSNFDTELSTTVEMYDINQTKGIKPI